MKRRTLVVAGAAVLAAAAGGGTAWWRGRPSDKDVVSKSQEVWSLTFPKVDGGTLIMSALKGRPLLLNFWATWCGPCVTEIPLLDRFAREKASNGWQVLALAVDGIEPVKSFLKQQALTLPVALAGAEGIDLSHALGNRQGALPFSVGFDASGRPFASNLGAVDETLLLAWVGLTR